MAQYMLSVHTCEGEAQEPTSPDEMQHSWQQIATLETEMKSTGAWVFSARLHDADTATVVRVNHDEILTTDGPFVEAREHLGGFYIVNAADLDAALTLAAKVTRAVGKPIEVRPFVATSSE